uniref:Secreted protein n=1 Tax=Anguilla anguilla TaxID=7936 RepID=A0A0E9QD83_ANGAN
MTIAFCPSLCPFVCLACAASAGHYAAVLTQLEIIYLGADVKIITAKPVLRPDNS